MNEWNFHALAFEWRQIFTDKSIKVLFTLGNCCDVHWFIIFIVELCDCFIWRMIVIKRAIYVQLNSVSWLRELQLFLIAVLARTEERRLKRHKRGKKVGSMVTYRSTGHHRLAPNFHSRAFVHPPPLRSDTTHDSNHPKINNFFDVIT